MYPLALVDCPLTPLCRMPVSSVARELDCEWVVERCKTYLERGDKHSAKAWILTARSLFPDDFSVQYEAFCLHMSCEEVKEAAMALTDLFNVFPREAQLQSCLTGLVEALLATPTSSTQSQDKTIAQKKLVFNQLPGSVQKSVLLHAAADESNDVLRQCKVWVVIIKRFHDMVKTVGLDAYDLLSKEPSTTVMADDQSRELLVCEVIPLLLSSPEIHLDLPTTRSSGQSTALKTSHLCQWLESVASYYTTITSQTLLCGRSHRCAGKVGWDQLHQLLMRTAEKCSWREVIHSNQIGPHLPATIRWMGLQNLSGYNPHVKPFEAPRSVAIACFYIAVFLFFEMAWDYCSEMLAPAFGGSSVPVAARAPWLVVEDYQHTPSTSLEDKANKRRKTDDSKASLNFSTGSRSVDQKMVERFMVATDCWDFLQSNVTYQQEFMRLGQQWGVLEWSWLGMFRADMAIFKCDHTMAMQILTHEWHKVTEDNKTSPMPMRFITQMVNCAIVLGDSKGACSFASEVISLLPISQGLPGANSSPRLPPAHSSGRQLRLLCCTPEEVMPYCMEVIIRTLKDVAFGDPKNDRALGHLLVLLQYQWPKEEEIFASLITTIQKRRRFCFPEFFEYIILIDILEEMLYLANCDSLQITLLPQNDVNKGRTVTRGVNRGAREELMLAMEQQIKHCDEPIEPLLRQFFKQEKLSLSGKYTATT